MCEKLIGFAHEESFEADIALVSVTDVELRAFQTYIANNPTAGFEIPGTGGARKLYWRFRNNGAKRGARVVYFYRDQNTHIVLLRFYLKFGKRRKDDLTPAEKSAIKTTIKALLKPGNNP